MIDWEDEISRRLLALGVREQDLEERFVRGGGAGGQKVNKTSSTVVLRHIPTGIEVRCQKERSQALNRRSARIMLCNAFEERKAQQRRARDEAVSKARGQRMRRSRGAQARNVESKRRRSQVKANRNKFGD